MARTAARWAVRAACLVAFVLIPGASVVLALYAAYRLRSAASAEAVA